MPEEKHGELRCLCSRKPLLATYGLNDSGELYVHIKVFKQSRIYGEAIFTRGKVELHCRECLRWHRVVIRQPDGSPALKEQSSPSVPIED
jgi:hypothetical protein